MVKSIYTIFLAIIIALFVGLAIDTFYPGPVAPEYPESLSYPTKLNIDGSTQETPEMQAQRIKYDADMKEFDKLNKKYNRNNSLISLGAAIIILVISLVFLNKIMMISDGVLLGGVLTLAYSIGRGFDTDSNKYRFILVTVGMLIAFILGYIRFVKPHKELEK